MATRKGGDLAAFKATYDKRQQAREKIRARLKELGDSWEYETDLLRACGMATHTLATLRDEFADFTVRVPSSNRNTRTVWCGTKKLAAECREVLT